jgi:magnesium-transporting ATPase (P-type)
MEPTSEQELKQLLDEGKITAEEYQELLQAIRKKEESKLIRPKTNQTDNRKIIPIIFIVCGVLPFAIALIIKIMFGIGMIESMVIIAITVIPLLLVVKVALWLCRKNA